MRLTILENKSLLGKTAAEDAARSLRAALREKRTARIIAATGASQFEFLECLTKAEGIDWARVEGEIGPMAPASILRRHGNTTLYLDKSSASSLKAETTAAKNAITK